MAKMFNNFFRALYGGFGAYQVRIERLAGMFFISLNGFPNDIKQNLRHVFAGEMGILQRDCNF